MNKILKAIPWVCVSLAGATALAAIAFERKEPLNAVWFVVAAVATYTVAYRFYSTFIAAKVLGLDDTRATPAERLEDGKDFVPTNKWVLIGHHFAAIAGPGPLVGPTLAAQFGYMPGTLWLILGAVLGGCVQDFTTLFFSMRRNGKSLGQMAREEVGKRGGMLALLAVLAIMVILLAAVALIVVKALKDSPWGTFTLAMTIPIAMLMGIYLRFLRPGRVLEASDHRRRSGAVRRRRRAVGERIAGMVAGVHVLRLGARNRDHHLRIRGVRPASLAAACAARLSERLHQDRRHLSRWPGAFSSCGPRCKCPRSRASSTAPAPSSPEKFSPSASSPLPAAPSAAFHALIASGTTPKMIMHESNARMIGYGAMLMESFVGVMAMVAACALSPGVYFAINRPAGIVGKTAEAAAATIRSWGFALDPQTMATLAQRVGERTLLDRTGGAPSLAVGMAQIFSGTIGGDRLLSIWYHFAIMFEALFILTVLDAGTRVGRFMVQELGGHIWKPLGRRGWTAGNLDFERPDVRRVGIFSVAGSAGPARRNQFRLAALRDRQSIAGGGGAGRRHHDSAEDGPAAMDLGDARCPWRCW